MSTTELQACLARLYTDDSFRKLWDYDAEATLGAYFLTPSERQAISNIDRNMLEFFASSLKTKRKKRLKRAYPALFALDGPALAAYYSRYYEIYPLRPNGNEAEEILEFGVFMEETLKEAQGLPPYVSELVRFERIIQALRFQSRTEGTDSSAKKRHERAVQLTDYLSLHPGVTVERFIYNVSEIDDALRNGHDTVIARPEGEFVVYGHHQSESEPRVLRVSAPAALLIKLCDGTRSVEDIIALVEEQYGQHGLVDEILLSVDQLRGLEILELTDPLQGDETNA
jgi:hypothetical protein